jgi:hypothetical protein
LFIQAVAGCCIAIILVPNEIFKRWPVRGITTSLLATSGSFDTSTCTWFTGGVVARKSTIFISLIVTINTGCVKLLPGENITRPFIVYPLLTGKGSIVAWASIISSSRASELEVRGRCRGLGDGTKESESCR